MTFQSIGRIVLTSGVWSGRMWVEGQRMPNRANKRRNAKTKKGRNEMARNRNNVTSAENEVSEMETETITPTESENSETMSDTTFYADDITEDVSDGDIIAETEEVISPEGNDSPEEVAAEEKAKEEKAKEVLELIKPEDITNIAVRAMVTAAHEVKNDYEKSNGILTAVTSGAEEKEKHYLASYKPGTDEMLDRMLSEREKMESEIESLKLKLMTTANAISANVKSKVLTDYADVNPEKLEAEVKAKYEAFRKTRGTLVQVINSFALADPNMETDVTRYIGNVNSPSGSKKSSANDTGESRAYLKISLVEVETEFGTWETIEIPSKDGKQMLSNFEAMKDWLDKTYEPRVPRAALREWFFKTNGVEMDDVDGTQIQTVGDLTFVDRKNGTGEVTRKFRVTRATKS